MSIPRCVSAGAVFLALAGTAGCGDLLTVTNPGGIQDEALNSSASVPALVTGMSADLSLALARTSWWGSVWSDDLTHSGTLGAPSVFSRGDIPDDQVNAWWAEAHRARWAAETGTERIRQILGAGYERSALAARANLLAGFANRLLGENVCAAVIDGGPEQPFAVHFTRAEEQFTEAHRLATAAGEATLARAALAGRASVRAAMGNWSGARGDAVQIPSDFRYDAVYSLNTSRENNGWTGYTRTRGEYTVWGTRWAQMAGDPRVPQEQVLNAQGQQVNGANGQTPWIRQAKYLTDAAGIPLTKGTEMLLIRAEAALRDGERGEAMVHINAARGEVGLGPAAAGSDAEAWALLRDERGATLWLEGRRFWDLRRWNQENGPARDGFLDGRDACVPISASERASNNNLGG